MKQENLYETENEKKILKPGDVIHCHGLVVALKEIEHQEWYQETGFLAEFFDTDGNYRSWKQYLDGGYVEK